ncbi:MAG: deoxyhypusine synthase family protein [Planctomycetota bacterium]
MPQADRPYQQDPVRPLRPSRAATPDALVRALGGCGFQGRRLARATDIWEAMCRDQDCLKVLTLAGALVPAGMGEVLCELIEGGAVDAVVSTGANVIHDFVDSVVDGGHWLGTDHADDDDLRRQKINRVFDVYIAEQDYEEAEALLNRKLEEAGWTERTFLPSELVAALGEWAPRRCLVRVAAEHGVPIFVPAISDSELGINVATARVVRGHQNAFDEVGDIQRFAEVIGARRRWGTVILGGGVPRNWAQQVFPYLEAVAKARGEPPERWPGYHYGIQITTDRPDFGGLSGCTFSESKSWGKYDPAARFLAVVCDATIALPLIATALLQRLRA